MSNINKIRYNGIDYGVGDEANNNNYSIEEQIIGTWTDGKPLYRKVFDCGEVTADKVINSGIENLDIITHLYGISKCENMQDFFPLDFRENNYGYGLFYNYARNEIHIALSQSAYAGTKVYVIIEYTKTTD